MFTKQSGKFLLIILGLIFVPSGCTAKTPSVPSVSITPVDSFTSSPTAITGPNNAVVLTPKPIFTPTDIVYPTSTPAFTLAPTASSSLQTTFTPQFTPTTPPPTLEALWLNLPAPTISASNLKNLEYQTALGFAGMTALSSNGQYLAVIANHRIALYDFKTLREINLAQDPSEEANDVAFQVKFTEIEFSPKSDMVTATYNTALGGGFWIWRTADGELLYSSTDKWGWTYSLEYSPDGTTIALGNYARIVLFDIQKFEVTRWWKAHTWMVDDIAFSSDGKTLASVSSDNTIQIWNTADGASLYLATGTKKNEPLITGVLCVAISSDGSFLATGSGYGFVEIWRILKTPYKLQRELVWEAEDNGSVNDLAFSRDGTFLASASWHGIRFWSMPDGRLIHELKNIKGNIIFSPDDTLLIVGNQFWLVK